MYGALTPMLLRHKVAALERTQAVVELSLDGTILRANPLFLQLMGYSQDQVRGQSYSMFVPANDAQANEYDELWAQLKNGEHAVGEFCRMHASGRPIWVHGVYCPLLDESGQPYRVMKFAADITANKQRDADFAGQIAAIRMSQAIAEFDLDGYLLDANSKFLESMGYRLESLRGRHHSVFVDPGERENVEYKAFWWRLRDGNYHAGLYKRIDAFGNPHWIQASYNPVRDENGRLAKVVKFATDQTSAVEDHLRVDYLYRHDTLTGLANRAGLKFAFDDATAGQAIEAPPTLLLIDLDRLKQINDSFGHLGGDHCLTISAARIRAAASEAVIVARLGGDEFVVLLKEASSAAEIAERIIAAVKEPFEWNGELHCVGASIGISRDGITLSDLLRTADLALYAAKGAGRGVFRTYPLLNCVDAPGLQPRGSATLLREDAF